MKSMGSKPRALLCPALCLFVLLLLSFGCGVGVDESQNSVATPQFSPPAGTYTEAQDVAITTSTADAAIRYTTDGSTPTETSGTLYSAPVHIGETLILKAVAYRWGWTTSYMASGQYTISSVVAAPAFSPSQGTYTTALDVSITTTTAGAAIRYTIDGSTPSETYGTLYAGPVPVAETLTLKAVAYRADLTTSTVTSGLYTIAPQVTAPAFSPAPGAYADPQDVTISTPTPGAAVRYTTDGTTPTDTVGTVYTAPVRIAVSSTLKAVAYLEGWTTSTVTSGEYTIGLTVAAPEFSITPGMYASAQDVAVTTATTGATIRYTTDGSTPTDTVGTVYAAPVRVDRSLTLKAVAYRAGWTTSPVTVGEYRRVGVSAGASHTILAKSDGTVWAWGGNSEGQVGDGTTTSRSAPIQVLAISGAVAVSAGYYHSVALTSEGAAWAWGRNMYGQLGDGTSTQRLSPVQVPGLSGVTAVAGSENSTYALKGDGTVWAWGHNNEGQLGDGTKTDRFSPVQVQGLSNVAAVSAGALHGAALRSDGTVWTWGCNVFGALGDGTTTSRLTPIQVPSLSGMIGIAADGYHTLAVKNDGTLWAWGTGSFGELGNGAMPMFSSTPVQAIGLTAAAAAEAGAYHSIALLDDGTLAACGYNLYGQLGDGTNTNRSIAVPVLGISSVVAVGAGYLHTVAIVDNGTVWAWGHNHDYQLGDGTTTDRWVPVQVIW